jgi:hypothetical protein
MTWSSFISGSFYLTIKGGNVMIDEDFDDIDFENIDDLPLSDYMSWDQQEAEDIADDEFSELD